MKELLHLRQGEIVEFQGRSYTILRVEEDLATVLARDTINGVAGRLPVCDLSVRRAQAESLEPVSEQLTPDQLAHAQRRAAALTLLNETIAGKRMTVSEVAAAYQVHPATIYRWLERWDDTGRVSAMANRPGQGAKGRSRLTSEVESLIQNVIETFYLTKQRRRVQQTYLELKARFAHHPEWQVPCLNTLRKRIAQINGRERTLRRYGSREAREQYDQLKGGFSSSGPLDIVQIDHTLLDLMLVDEMDRTTCIGRPWITIAMDVYSRMVIGFHVSFDPPGAMGTGLCLAHAILPKELGMRKLDVDGEWPCWGVPRLLHLDNAREFRGNMLQTASKEYGFKLQWRIIGRPEYGGHIERLMGTVLQEIHMLPGTTFSNIKARGRYDSEGKAVLTLHELEVWLTRYFVSIYHQRNHTALGATPLQQFLKGMRGSAGADGVQPRVVNEHRLRLDFMPSMVRSIQDYGVVIDHIHYQADVLGRWVDRAAPSKGNALGTRQFIFKRDPRDISKVYFWDPELCRYYAIPYRNVLWPAMSIWQYREALRIVKQQQQPVNETLIFEARARQQAIVNNAKRLTKAARREQNRKPIEVVLPPVILASTPPAPLALPVRVFRPYTDLHDGLLTS
ncbi:helix-turn-helix domain-containing protein [Hymenobacter sp. GOD-10R]|uniref:helix-turn-helix domain-containing protein n=1 Tax=Hymenobacter sp. GOD-10R TaxID=3093922 RepID=UPI002D78EE49|nr:helix-turn-helix domain-containing protein [Hymenobacter sp. GOD-10R]WRQ28145.1 helix-turn-helix domain-containing protein [Hymenobacter sp. GOD-10R]